MQRHENASGFYQNVRRQWSDILMALEEKNSQQKSISTKISFKNGGEIDLFQTKIESSLTTDLHYKKNWSKFFRQKVYDSREKLSFIQKNEEQWKRHKWRRACVMINHQTSTCLVPNVANVRNQRCYQKSGSLTQMSANSLPTCRTETSFPWEEIKLDPETQNLGDF